MHRKILVLFHKQFLALIFYDDLSFLRTERCLCIQL